MNGDPLNNPELEPEWWRWLIPENRMLEDSGCSVTCTFLNVIYPYGENGDDGGGEMVFLPR